MGASSCSSLKFPKGDPRRVRKYEQDEEETRVIRETRRLVWRRSPATCEGCGDTEYDTERRLLAMRDARPSKHEMHEVKSRAQTRGLPPTERFNTRNCGRLCPICHADITENRKVVRFKVPRLGCDGGFTLATKHTKDRARCFPERLTRG